MTLDLTGDAQTFLHDFGETVTYKPRSGKPRAIKAVVDRSPPAPVEPGAIAPLATITVANDQHEGIASDQLDTGGDEVDMAVRVGAEPTTRTITALLDQDDGMITLEVR